MTKNYLVVGGTSGIGRATVIRLARDHDANVVFCGRNTEAGAALSQTLTRDTGGTVRYVSADVTSDADVTALFDVVETELPRLDGAFNVAGAAGRDTVLRGVRFHESDEENFDRVFAVNVKGMWRCLRHQLRVMTAQGFGAIVNCASVAGLRSADSLSASYTASKHAVVGLTRALAVEYAREGIRINAICPGVIDTDMLGGMRDSLLEDLRTKNPAARLGTADETAEAVAFLLSERAGYISGATLTIDAGGLTGAL